MRHEYKRLVAEEGHPASRNWIWLWERSDQSVPLIAECLARGGVKSCDQLARMTFGALPNSAPVGFDEIHREEAWLGVMHARHRELGAARELAEHVSLEREVWTVASVSRARLDREMPAVGKLRLDPDQAKTDGKRLGIDDGRAERVPKSRRQAPLFHCLRPLTLSANVISLKQTHRKSPSS